MGALTDPSLADAADASAPAADTSALGPADASRGSSVDASRAGEVDGSRPCPACHGCSRPCAACVTAAGDPRPEDFAVGSLAPDATDGAHVEGTWTCVCGRAYGIYRAGRSTCLVIHAPGRRQVYECVRCGRDLARTHRLAGDDRQLAPPDPSSASASDASSESPGDASPAATGDPSAAAATDAPPRAAADDASPRAAADASAPAAVDASPSGPADESRASGDDASRRDLVDASSPGERDGSRACAWCREPIPEFSKTGRRRRADADTCGKPCRQNRWKWKLEQARLEQAAQPMRFAYADPPYPGRGGLYPEGEEVDHAQLIARLVAQFPDGWALSTAADALQAVLALCPPGVRVGSWTRHARRAKSRRPVSAWEPLIVCGGRELRSDRPQTALDAIVEDDVDERELTTALIHRGRHRSYPGAIIGMKPPRFAAWLFEQLGARPGDQLADLYPGSGAISRAWTHYTGAAAGLNRNSAGGVGAH